MASLLAVSLDALEAPIVDAVRALDSATTVECAGKLVRERPFTDAALPKMGGNVASPLFKSNYLREIPTIGNALRQSIDDYERSRQYSFNVKTSEKLYYDRAMANVVADLDMLDLLRNKWLDALQDLDNSDDPRDLDTARSAAHDYVRVADIRIPPGKITSC